MSRATRVEFDGAIYIIMSRGVARMPVFHDDDDRGGFLGRFEGFAVEGALVVHTFCPMPNRCQLLWETADSVGSSATSMAAKRRRLVYCALRRYSSLGSLRSNATAGGPRRLCR